MDFFYSFIVTLIHSIWQAALLLFVYWLINLIGKNYHPLQKRNFLYLLFTVQVLISSITLFSLVNNFSFTSSRALLNFFQGDQLPFFYNYYVQIFIAYISIIAFKIVQLIIQWASFKNNYTTQLKRPTADLKIFTAYHANLLSIKKNVTLWFSNSIKTPVTFGFLKPVILLPVSLINNITAQQAELIILHELIHIKNKDYLLNWFLIAMETIYFFNPFIKIAAEQLKLEREKNCDIQVLNYKYGCITYAETLFEIAKNQNKLKRFQLGVYKNESQLFKRISFFSKEQNLSFKQLNFYFLSLLLALLLGTISFVMMANIKISLSSITNVFTEPIQEPYQKSIVYASPLREEKAVVSKQKIKKRKASKHFSEEQNAIATLPVNEQINTAENFFIPVAYSENIDSTKEVIYNVETKNTTVTQSYKMIKKNGVWVFEPQWMIVEKRPDSAYVSKKDSLSTPTFY